MKFLISQTSFRSETSGGVGECWPFFQAKEFTEETEREITLSEGPRSSTLSEAPNENIVQNHLNRALLNVF